MDWLIQNKGLQKTIEKANQERKNLETNPRANTKQSKKQEAPNCLCECYRIIGPLDLQWRKSLGSQVCCIFYYRSVGLYCLPFVPIKFQ